MPNNITNQTAATGPVNSEPVQSSSQPEQEMVKRRLRAQSSVASARTRINGNVRTASSRASVIRSGTAQRRGASSAPRRLGSVNRGLSNRARPILSLPEFDIPSPFINQTLADSSSIETGFTQSGQLLQTLNRDDGTSQESLFSFFPSRRGPGGHRIEITEFDDRGREQSTQSISVLLSRLANDSFNATAVDLSDPTNPVHLYNSNINETEVYDDNGRQLYDSRTTYADGSVIEISNEQLEFDSSDYDPQFPSGYRTTTTRGGSSRVLETKSITDENGFRVTTVTDITDETDPVLISTDTKPDPFILSERNSGIALNDYIDHIDEQGFINITGSDEASAELDLILIHRYNKGERGADLFADLDLTNASKAETEIEAKLAQGFANGVYDIDGSGSQNTIDGISGPNPVDEYDMDFLARYMIGARGSALTDNRFADDDSIRIASDGSNIISLENDSPILTEMQEIFGVEGQSLRAGDQELKLFYINLSQGSEGFESSGGRVARSIQTESSGARRARGALGGRAVPGRTGNTRITRLDDLTADAFDD